MDARDRLRRTYDAVTDEYVRRIYNELDGKPLDRSLLDRFADAVRDVGQVGDVGCGPGQVARYLHERGVTVVGIAVLVVNRDAFLPSCPFFCQIATAIVFGCCKQYQNCRSS